MRPLKILYQNRPQDSWIGGDYVQMLETANRLGKMGCTIEILEQPLLRPAIRVREFDLIHTWNFSMDWAKYAVVMADIHHKPLVSSMIYAETDNFTTYQQQQVMIDRVNAAIFLNQGELDRARRHLVIQDEKIHFVPNGIDKSWFKKQNVKQNEPFILTVARLEPFKGQLAVAKACKELGIKYVCAGERHDEAYAKEVEQAGGILIGAQGKEELMRLYATCSVMVLASRAEIMSLAVMEAMAQNAKIVLTDHSEWKPDVSYCEYDNVESIKDAISKEMMMPRTNISIVKDMTWDNVAKQILDIYEQTVIKYKKPEPFKITDLDKTD